MMNSFALPPTLVRELGYLFNGGQRSGWADRVGELLGVSPRTIESWARGERECEGPPALLMAHLARMMVEGTYSDISLDEVEAIIEKHGKKIALDLNLPEVRASIRSLIKLTSSIKKAAEDLGINRSALSRWLSGDNVLRFDLVSKVLDYVGLNRDVDARFEKMWHVIITENPDDELIQNIKDAVSLFFPALPECSIIQAGEQIGRSALLIAILGTKRRASLLKLKCLPNFFGTTKG